MPNVPPTQSNALAESYTSESLDRKVRNKTELQKRLKWTQEPRRPMLCLPGGMTEALGGALLEEVLPGLLSLPIEILILGKGSKRYGELFTQLAKEHKHRIAIIPESDKTLVENMYAAADMAIFFTDPSAQKELKTCLQYGVIPIAPRTSALEPYDPVQESGMSFDYDQLTMWQCFGAVVRALETHKFPFDWRTIQRHCMESVE